MFLLILLSRNFQLNWHLPCLRILGKIKYSYMYSCLIQMSFELTFSMFWFDGRMGQLIELVFVRKNSSMLPRATLVMSLYTTPPCLPAPEGLKQLRQNGDSGNSWKRKRQLPYKAIKWGRMTWLIHCRVVEHFFCAWAYADKHLTGFWEGVERSLLCVYVLSLFL